MEYVQYGVRTVHTYLYACIYAKSLFEKNQLHATSHQLPGWGCEHMLLHALTLIDWGPLATQQSPAADMPQLHEFVGTRENPINLSGTTGGSVMHQSSKNERMRLIIQGLASSADPLKTKSVPGSQDTALSGRQLIRNENGISSQTLGVSDIPSGTSNTKTRWHGYRPVVRASSSMNDRPWPEPDAVDGIPLDDDIFGTDIENLDSTVASSDLASSDVGDVQSRPGEGNMGRSFITNLHQRFEPGKEQQGNTLPRSEYPGYQPDENRASLGKDFPLRDIAGKGQKINANKRTNDQRFDPIDRMARHLNTNIHELDLDVEGLPGRSQGLPLIGGFRPKLAPPLPEAHKIVSTKISMESSANAANVILREYSDVALHTSNGASGTKCLPAGEPRQEVDGDSEDKRYNDMKTYSGAAQVNRMNALQPCCKPDLWDLMKYC